jgi:hypothetical protein
MVRIPWDAWCWCPFRDEVSKDLALDGMAWLEVELKSSELSCPLGDVARGVGIVEDCHTLKYLILVCDYLLQCVHLSIRFFENFNDFSGNYSIYLRARSIFILFGKL